ncbi:hypothetical protein ACFWBV_32020 [Streptomyces sp. NPDC060030]|uniref:hypothetical protein n=1 Tax=Streptomyces sp. NPDC060030 TaxID=3347042 RepID=UPI0036C78B61
MEYEEIRPSGVAILDTMKTYEAAGTASFEPRLPPSPPPPPVGCDVCSDLVEQRQNARAEGDYSRATDASVLIGRHPHADEELR